MTSLNSVQAGNEASETRQYSSERTIEVIISTGSVDRDGDRVNPKGWDFSEFSTNPVVLWMHDMNIAPPAKCLDAWYDEEAGVPKAKIKFAKTPFAEELLYLYKNGFLNAVSATFSSIEYDGNNHGGKDFHAQKLIELSLVTVPANKEALVTQRSFAPSKKAFPLFYKHCKSLIKKVEKQEDEPTDFPEEGDNLKVSLANSEYDRPPMDWAKSIKEDHPEIWDAGGNTKGNDQWQILTKIIEENNGSPETPDQEQAIRDREAWAARHFKNHELAGVVAQIKWLVVGSRGLDHQKKVIRDAIESKEDKYNEQTKFYSGPNDPSLLNTIVGIEDLSEEMRAVWVEVFNATLNEEEDNESEAIRTAWSVVNEQTQESEMIDDFKSMLQAQNKRLADMYENKKQLDEEGKQELRGLMQEQMQRQETMMGLLEEMSPGEEGSESVEAEIRGIMEQNEDALDMMEDLMSPEQDKEDPEEEKKEEEHMDEEAKRMAEEAKEMLDEKNLRQVIAYLEDYLASKEDKEDMDENMQEEPEKSYPINSSDLKEEVFLMDLNEFDFSN